MSGPPPGYIPPPPPPPPPQGWEPPKPTSGKAIAALVCGLAGPIAAFMCAPLGVAVIAGVILGILALIETGRNGTRSGRGLAIAGTIVSTLGVVATIAMIVAFVALLQFSEQEGQRDVHGRVAQDQELLLERIQEYHRANGGSLGPGGPVLAGERRGRGNSPDGSMDGRVSGALGIDHLASSNELRLRRGGAGWELTVTGANTATLRARGWDGEIIREIEIRDAGRGNWVQTVP
jgi:hypothetical protein